MPPAPRLEVFSLDRDTLRDYMCDIYGEPTGLAGALPGDHEAMTTSLAHGLNQARDCAALLGPQGIVLQVYERTEQLLLGVRERENPPDAPLRQVCGYSIDTRDFLLGGDPETFAGACAAIEAVLAKASELLPLLRLIQVGEARGYPADHGLPEISAYHDRDGAIVINIDTAHLPRTLTDATGQPYLRVTVNGTPIHAHSPSQPLPGSPLAGAVIDRSSQPIGRLIVELPAS